MFSEGDGAAVFEIAQDPGRLVGESMLVPVRPGKAPEDLRDLELRTRVRVRVHQLGLICLAIASSGDCVFAMVVVLTCT